MYKFHYVYRITNIITKMHYYGDRSCNCLPSKDLGIKYFSSFRNFLFKIDQINNPSHYKYKVIKTFISCRKDATDFEIFLHKKFNVKDNPKFINRANQTSSKFIPSKSSSKKTRLSHLNNIDSNGNNGYKQLANSINQPW